MHVLGVRIDEGNRESTQEKALNFLKGGGQHTIFTPNPEMIVEAQKDAFFKDVLNGGSLNICDGKGTHIAGKGKLTRITGIDFLHDLCEMAESSEKSVYLLGSGSKDVISTTKDRLLKRYKGLRIAGAHPGIDLDIDEDRLQYDDTAHEELIDDIILAAPDILFVGFGQNKQERWIKKHLHELPSVKIAMGVGGSFDMIAGRYPRAPRLLRILGLEWLWRLMRQPSRIKRIWNATGRFGWHYIRSL